MRPSQGGRFFRRFHAESLYESAVGPREETEIRGELCGDPADRAARALADHVRACLLNVICLIRESQDDELFAPSPDDLASL